MLRVHHTVGDGLSLMAAALRVMESMDGSELELGGSEVGAALAEGRRGEHRGAKKFSVGQVILTDARSFFEE